MTRSVEQSAPPSIALAIMALNLAGRRKWAIQAPFAQGAKPLKRKDVWDLDGMSVEYYRIIDRIARGEQP